MISSACPIIAQAAATIAVMSESRFTLALGAGERLNEHVVGYGLLLGNHSMRHPNGAL